VVVHVGIVLGGDAAGDQNPANEGRVAIAMHTGFTREGRILTVPDIGKIAGPFVDAGGGPASR